MPVGQFVIYVKNEDTLTPIMPLADGMGQLLIVLAATRNGQSQPLEVDEITNALVTIPVVHHEIHESETWIVSSKSADGAPIADNGNFDLLFRVGAGINAHATGALAAGGDAEFLLYENPTATLDGTPIARVAMDRSNVQVATSVGFVAPTIGAVGTQLFQFFSPGGTGGNSAGGVGSIARPNTEWILRAGQDYLWRGINRAGNAQPMAGLVQWYEEGA